jgi:C1A family cysteine protease
LSNLPLSPGGHRFGFHYGPRNHAEYGLCSVPNLKFAEPPPSDEHLAEFMQAVKNQGDLGACTAFASAADREATAAQYENKKVVLSPLFLYYIERQIDDTLADGDTGSTGETSCKAQNQFGICPESVDPYEPKTFNNPPTAAQLAAALEFKNGAYHTLYNAQDVKLCINSGYRVRIGMTVFQSFEYIGHNGLMPVPNDEKENVLGGHELLIYGYDDSIKCPGAHSKGAVKIRNSWGKAWGLDGDLWMAQELLSPDSIVSPDLRIQHLGKPWVN